jgi:hypothetical protein
VVCACDSTITDTSWPSAVLPSYCGSTIAVAVIHPPVPIDADRSGCGSKLTSYAAGTAQWPADTISFGAISVPVHRYALPVASM